MLLGLAIGVFARPELVYESFCAPLFHGSLSILMLVRGMEAWARLAELRKVAERINPAFSRCGTHRICSC